MATAFKTIEQLLDALVSPDTGAVSDSALRRANVSRTMFERMRKTQSNFVKTMDRRTAEATRKRLKTVTSVYNLAEASAPKDTMFGWGEFPNIPNNRYNHALAPFMELQSPQRRIVNGKWSEYTPKTPWMDARGRINGPSANWAPGESKPRLPGLKPTSSCFSQFYYFPISKIMLYKFRNHAGDTYQKVIPRSVFNRWITSGSLGRFYNAHIRGK